MVISAAIRRATDSVIPRHSYFQTHFHHHRTYGPLAASVRQTDEQFQIMNLNLIPPAARDIVVQVYSILSLVFAILAFVSRAPCLSMVLTDSSSLHDVLWIFGCGFGMATATMMWATEFSFFYRCNLGIIVMGMIEGTASIVSTTYSPFFTFPVYMAVFWFVMYVIVYSQFMVQRIIEGDDSRVNHSVRFFTDFCYITFHFFRMVSTPW